MDILRKKIFIKNNQASRFEFISGICFCFFYFLFVNPINAQWQEHKVTDQAVSPKKVIAADIDGDGLIDIISMNSEKIEWYKNLGDGNFSDGILVGELIDGRDIAVGDINGNGHPDIVGVRAGYYSSYNMFWYENLDGDGNFSAPKGISTPHTEGGLRVKIGDIDHDGHLDIVATTIEDRKLAWYKNSGNGTFDAGTVISSGYTSGYGLDIGDIDNDGDMDIVVNTPNYAITSWFENLDGTGNFGEPREIGTRKMNLQSLFLADIDGDESLDVIGSGSVHEEEVFSWWKNLDGQGNFSTQEHVIDTILTTFIYPVDLDLDGDLDVLTLAPGYLKWYENLDGQGNFGEAQIIKDDLPFAITVTAADLMNNGTINPITASQRLNTIYWFKPTTVNIEDFKSESITVYPNPVENILSIKTEKPISLVILYDVLNREVFRTDSEEKEIFLSHLNSGVYVLEIQTAEQTVFKRIVKK